MEIKKESFGQTRDGQETALYTLKNKNGMQVKVAEYGATVTAILVPDKNENLGNVVLGFDSMSGYQSDEYLESSPYFGAIVGRYGNRIANGKFTLEGKEYHLATNNGPNHLHGGIKGFDKVMWQAVPLENENALKLTYVSADGEEGYPGQLTSVVTYTLTDNNELKIDIEATTDKTTHLNLTNHSYFNLASGKADDALGHELTLYADKYVVVDDTFIPTGELRGVSGSSMDFTSSHTIGARIKDVKGGYDHTYVLRDSRKSLRKAATVVEPVSGRRMEVYTTEPGIQFYSGNFLDGTNIGSHHKSYVKHYGFALETQHFPDSPNQPDFPSTVLHPDETYTTTTFYKFSVDDNQK